MPSRPASSAQRSRSRGTATRRRRRPSRRGAVRRRRRAGIGATVWIAVMTVTVFAGLVGIVALAGHALTSAAADRESVASPAAPPPPPPAPAVAGYGVDQLENACFILAAGRDLGMDERDQTIAVMTAMGESSLRNIDYGDWETSGVTNPDGSRTTSIGLFQQQDGWGSRESRLDPYASATIFYRAMAARVPDRSTVEPTLVAHRTQINADPRHYERFWERAQRVVAALNAQPLVGDSIRGIPACAAGQP